MMSQKSPYHRQHPLIRGRELSRRSLRVLATPYFISHVKLQTRSETSRDFVALREVAAWLRYVEASQLRRHRLHNPEVPLRRVVVGFSDIRQRRRRRTSSNANLEAGQ